MATMARRKRVPEPSDLLAVTWAICSEGGGRIHIRSGREVKFAPLLAGRARDFSLRADAIGARGEAYCEAFTASEEQ